MVLLEWVLDCLGIAWEWPEDGLAHYGFLWHLTGQLLTDLKHQNFVQSIELLHSHTLLSASYDGTIRTWTI